MERDRAQVRGEVAPQKVKNDAKKDLMSDLNDFIMCEESKINQLEEIFKDQIESQEPAGPEGRYRIDRTLEADLGIFEQDPTDFDPSNEIGESGDMQL